MLLWAKFLSSSLLTKILLIGGIGLGLAYGGAFLTGLYKTAKQNLYRHEVKKENKKNVKKECAYGFTDTCD